MRINIPVQMEEFVQKNGNDYVVDSSALGERAHKIYENFFKLIDKESFISQYGFNLAEDWSNLYNLLRYNLDELINNCLDAGVTIMRKKGVDAYKLTIEIILLPNDKNSFCIKIKDNGTGFSFLNDTQKHDALALSKYRNTHQVSDKKGVSGYLGGKNIGLFRLSKTVDEYKGEIYIKNRKIEEDKEGGASVIMQFKR